MKKSVISSGCVVLLQKRSLVKWYPTLKCILFGKTLFSYKLFCNISLKTKTRHKTIGSHVTKLRPRLYQYFKDTVVSPLFMHAFTLHYTKFTKRMKEYDTDTNFSGLRVLYAFFVCANNKFLNILLYLCSSIDDAYRIRKNETTKTSKT